MNPCACSLTWSTEYPSCYSSPSPSRVHSSILMLHDSYYILWFLLPHLIDSYSYSYGWLLPTVIMMYKVNGNLQPHRVYLRYKVIESYEL